MKLAIATLALLPTILFAQSSQSDNSGPGSVAAASAPVSRADYQLFRNWFSLNLTQPTRYYRSAFLNFNAHQQLTTDGLVTQRDVNFNWHVQFPNTWWGHIGSSHSGFGDVFDDRQTRGGPAMRVAKQGDLWGGIEGDQRWPVTPFLFGGIWRGDDGRTHG